MSRLTKTNISMAIEILKHPNWGDESDIRKAVADAIKGLKELQHYKDLEEQGRLIVTDEPRKPLIAGADTLYCPGCGSDLMGGFPYIDDTEMFQCRYCGQWINEKEQPIKLAELKGEKSE